MNIERLQKQLELDEGVVYRIYLDHLGYATFGIGHLITDKDPEKDQPVYTSVTKERVAEAFKCDVSISIAECKVLYKKWDEFPDEVQEILVNMMFNLGRPRYSKFRKHIQAVMDGNWQESANQMRDSRWHKQVPNRAERLCKRMEEIEV